MHPNGSLFVSDTLNHAIRRIDFTTATNSDSAELYLTLNPALTIFGTPGASYRIDAAEQSPGGTNWTTVATVTLTKEAELWYDPQPATRKKRIYRAVKTSP